MKADVLMYLLVLEHMKMTLEFEACCIFDKTKLDRL